METKAREDPAAALDRLMEQLRALPPEEDARRRALQNEVWVSAYKLFQPEFDRETEDYIDGLAEAIRRYDPEKGRFSHYCRFLLGRRSRNEVKKRRLPAEEARKELARLVRRGMTEADARKRLYYGAPLSLDQPVGEDEDITRGELLADPAGDPTRQLEALQPVLELCALVLHFAERHQGRAANETRRMWYRLFYTEDMTHGAKNGLSALVHSRDVFGAIDTDYLDYYMARVCRSLGEIAASPLKPYHAVVPERQQPGETPVPLPGDASLAFLRIVRGITAGASARSNQLRFYQEEKGRLAQC